MLFRCCFSNAELSADFFCGSAVRQQPEHICFTFGQFVTERKLSNAGRRGIRTLAVFFQSINAIRVRGDMINELFCDIDLPIREVILILFTKEGKDTNAKPRMGKGKR